jgi:hypothetical protein
VARQQSRETDDARFFGSVGPATRALSAFGTSALVPVLLIAVIMESPLAVVGSVVGILLLVWWTLRALRVGYRLDGDVLTACHSSRRTVSREIDLGRVKRTDSEHRRQLVLKMKDDTERGDADESPVYLELRKLSMDSAVRLRLVMETEFGIDCSTWGVTGNERARRDRDPDAGRSSGQR